MSLTIDYLAMPPKSQEVSQIKTGEQTRINQEHQEVAIQFQNTVKQQSETTVRRRDVDNEELKNEERNKGRNKKKQSKEAAKKEEEEEAKEKERAVTPFRGGLFDMKI